MASEPATDMDDIPLVAFSTVWVKMEVEEHGTVDVDLENDQETEDNSQESQVNQVQTRRSRRKPAAPRRAKNVEEKIFRCEYCDYKAVHKSSLKYHLMKHTKPTPQPCSICSYTTNHAASLRRHMLAVHTDQNDPIIQAMPDKKCKDCDFTCKLSWKLFIHRRKHVEKSFQCDQCEFATARKSNFEKHCKTHKHAQKDSVTYECDKCPFVTKHEGHISRHLAVVHKEVSEDASKCDFCEFSTKVRWRLNIHKKNSRQEKPIKCEFCDFITDYNCQYKLHKNQHIADMACAAAGIKLPKDHQSTDIYKPPRGSANVSQSGTLETPSIYDKGFIVDAACAEVDWRSIEVGERPGQEKPFHCILCPYQSKFKAAVQRHFQRNHTSDHSKPYKCVHCEFSTKTRDQISLHSKRSRSGYLITCKTCDFATFHKCQMAEHQKQHWQYKCKLCDFICRVSYDLNQHYTVVHLGQGLKCRYCDFKTARKGSLLNHETTHTNKKFRCGLCDYSATRRNLLFNHMKKCHIGQKPKIIISDRKFEWLKKIGDSQNVDESVNDENVERQNELETENQYDPMNFECQKSVNRYPSEENVESNEESEVKNDDIEKCESQSNFETQVFVQRESGFEDKSLEFQRNMFEEESMRSSQGNMYDIESRQNVFYPV